jgi:NDP-sugar pyrophosphorylase family protein
MQLISQLLILAGGKGSRLKHETRDIPKPLVKLFDDSCILGLLIDQYLPLFPEILILACYKADKIEEYIRENYHGENIRVLCEEIPSGTAGALRAHQDELANSFAVINGDTWFNSELDLSRLCLQSYQAGMVLTQVDNSARFGSVQRDASGVVYGFSEKNRRAQSGDNLINVGAYVFSKEVLSFITSLPCSLELDVFPNLISRQLLTSWVAKGEFLDIGVPETLRFARENRSFFNHDF